MKISFCLSVLFERIIDISDDDARMNTIAYFCSLNSPLTHVQNINKTIQVQSSEVNNKVENFINNGLGLIIDQIVTFEIKIGTVG